MPLAKVSGATLYYQHHRAKNPASRDPLVFVMGLGADLHAWSPQLDYFRDTHDVLLYDHRGVGGSPRPRLPRHGISLLADDLAQLLDHVGIQRVHGVGISLGGLVLQQLALRHPRKVTSLALASTYARPARHVGPMALGIMGRVILELSKSPFEKVTVDRTAQALMRSWAPLCFSPEFIARARDEIWQQVRGTVERNNRPDIALLQLAAILPYDARKLLRQVQTPTWVVIGDRDRMVPMQRARELADAIPGARFEVYPGVGHGLSLEAAERFNRALATWVDEVEGLAARRSA